MNLSKFFYFLITILIGLFFICLGTIGALMAWSATIREDIISFIVTNWVVFTLISFIMIAIGGAIVTFSVISIRHKYYRIRGGNKQILVDESLIQNYLDVYWEKFFPEKEIPNRVELKNNKIHVQAELPFIPLEDQRDLIQQIDSDLTEMFENILGYKQDFLLSISFQNETRIRKNIPA